MDDPGLEGVVEVYDLIGRLRAFPPLVGLVRDRLWAAAASVPDVGARRRDLTVPARHAHSGARRQPVFCPDAFVCDAEDTLCSMDLPRAARLLARVLPAHLQVALRADPNLWNPEVHLIALRSLACFSSRAEPLLASLSGAAAELERNYCALVRSQTEAWAAPCFFLPGFHDVNVGALFGALERLVTLLYEIACAEDHSVDEQHMCLAFLHDIGASKMDRYHDLHRSSDRAPQPSPAAALPAPTERSPAPRGPPKPKDSSEMRKLRSVLERLDHFEPLQLYTFESLTRICELSPAIDAEYHFGARAAENRLVYVYCGEERPVVATDFHAKRLPDPQSAQAAPWLRLLSRVLNGRPPLGGGPSGLALKHCLCAITRLDFWQADAPQIRLYRAAQMLLQVRSAVRHEAHCEHFGRDLSAVKSFLEALAACVGSRSHGRQCRDFVATVVDPMLKESGGGEKAAAQIPEDPHERQAPRRSRRRRAQKPLPVPSFLAEPAEPAEEDSPPAPAAAPAAAAAEEEAEEVEEVLEVEEVEEEQESEGDEAFVVVGGAADGAEWVFVDNENDF